MYAMKKCTTKCTAKKCTTFKFLGYSVCCAKKVLQLTTHTIRNLGYVLATWGDGEMLEAIDDATHSTTTETYHLYSRDTKRKHEI